MSKNNNSIKENSNQRTLKKRKTNDESSMATSSMLESKSTPSGVLQSSISDHQLDLIGKIYNRRFRVAQMEYFKDARRGGCLEALAISVMLGINNEYTKGDKISKSPKLKAAIKIGLIARDYLSIGEEKLDKELERYKGVKKEVNEYVQGG